MQIRLTLSKDDAIEARISSEAQQLNIRRRAEYLRRLLIRGFMAEREDIRKMGGFSDGSLSREQSHEHDYNNSTGVPNSEGPAKTGAAQVEASSLQGIFANQANRSTDGK